jgi:hypothetical protein
MSPAGTLDAGVRAAFERATEIVVGPGGLPDEEEEEPPHAIAVAESAARRGRKGREDARERRVRWLMPGPFSIACAMAAGCLVCAEFARHSTSTPG